MRESLSFLLEEPSEDSFFPETGEGLPLSDEHFHAFQTKKGRIGYVDGGSAFLIESPGFLLEKIRVVGIILDSGKRAEFKKEEYEVGIRRKASKWVLSITPEHQISKQCIDINEPSLRESSHPASIEKIGHLIRRLIELDFLARFASETRADLYVLDGSLEAATPFEQEYLAVLEEKPCVGLSKTSRCMTGNGRDVVSNLMRRKQGAWWYHPIRKGKESWDMAFVKLHEKSVYVFRLDFWKKNPVASFLPFLGGESQDPVFIGYPYGLIVTDQWARITNEEKAFWQLQLKVEVGKKWAWIAESLHSLDAHSVLDKIR